ncbi:MAG: discoidin domain-containing protein [Chitinispirillia bacterium]|nr:discoidin domain-containing protein [Chitinispirillia bacterium]MCL2269661.1 discoidin domain-containing protein [Chitinispirillia bacterium]
MPRRISFSRSPSPVLAALAVVCAFSYAPAQVSITVNNVGYEKTGVKRAVVQSSGAISAAVFELLNGQGAVVLSDSLGPQVTSASWSGDGFRNFRVADFSSVDTDGEGYRVRVGTVTSPPFAIGSKLLQARTGADQVAFFNKMRNTDDGDRNLPIFGSSQTRNIYGGWWDATGDPGKHLSHLSYANYYSPQQIPLVVWALLHANEAQPDAFGAAARSEAAWGADYLLRSLSSEGYFYMSVFDNWGDGHRWVEQPSGTRGEREICAWGTKDGMTFNDVDGTSNSDGVRSANYQSAMREGGGMSIAALARAAGANLSGGDSSSAQYLQGAVRAYEHLRAPANVTKYQDDGRLNIIDYYCGLLAATELYKATEGGLNPYYLSEARAWVDSILGLQSPEGWFYSGKDNNGQRVRPFHHAADEGLPVVALSRYYQAVALDGAEKLMLREAIGRNLRHYAKITYDGPNPFEYVKMYRASSPSLGGGDGGGGGAAGDLARRGVGTASRTEAGYTIANAFDGSSTTRWSSYQSGAQNDSQWIAVELDDVYKVNKVVINWENAFGKHYQIQVSMNGTNWTVAADIPNNESGGRKEHTFAAVEARHVRMFGITRGFEHGGFSLWDFEVYGEEPVVVVPPSLYQSYFFIPKVNETGYWWQGENARIASMASAFILGAPIADHTGEMWADTLFGMATAQLDWILGRNPFDLTMMFGYGHGSEPEYPDYPATRHIPNIKGGICNGISSARANENNIEWMPYGSGTLGDEFWRNWRFVEQWLPHNAWYLIAVSSLSYRMDNPIEPDDIISVRHRPAGKPAKLKIALNRGRNLRVELPFAADKRTEVAIYSLQGRKVMSHTMQQGARAASLKIPGNIACGMYVLSVRDQSGKSVAADRINLR